MTYLILAFANWRIAQLLTGDEAGPYNLLHRLRHIVGVRQIAQGTYGENEFAALFVCIWCMSIWTGLLITLAFWLWPQVTKRALLPFALSGAAILLDKNG